MKGSLGDAVWMQCVVCAAASEPAVSDVPGRTILSYAGLAVFGGWKATDVRGGCFAAQPTWVSGIGSVGIVAWYSPLPPWVTILLVNGAGGR